MKKILLVLSVVLFTATTAFAANWVEVYYKIYADANSVKYTNNNHVIVWEKWLNDGLFKPFNDQKVWYIMQKVEYDCNNERRILLAGVAYGLKEQVLFFYEDPSPDWKSVVPDTKSEYLYNFYCK